MATRSCPLLRGLGDEILHEGHSSVVLALGGVHRGQRRCPELIDPHTDPVVSRRALRQVAGHPVRLSGPAPREHLDDAFRADSGPEPRQAEPIGDPGALDEQLGGLVGRAARRLDARRQHEARDHEVDDAALGPELPALVEQPFGLADLAAHVVQLSEQRAGQLRGVGAAAC